MGNVGERATVDEGRSIFRGLDKIGIQSILEEDSNGSGNTQILDIEWFIVKCIAEEDIVQTPFEVLEVARKAEYCHNFGGRGDIESAFLGLAVGIRAETCDYLPERTVIDIEYTAPEYLP